ncbi:MAG: exostosin domain-containing protein [Vicinamibacterales bacterium]
MKVFLDTRFETDWAKETWTRTAASWNPSECEIVSEEAAADAVLITIVDPQLPYATCIEEIKRLPSRRARRDTVFVFDTADHPAGLFPGLYASLRRALFSGVRHRTACYLTSFNEFLQPQPRDPRPPLLFSFMGNLTAPVRARILQTPWNRKDVVVERTEPLWSRLGDAGIRPFKEEYVSVMGRSRFVLCPKGNGTSSFRLFETMQCGRVPVIIADSWVPCGNVDWASCSIRVREADVSKLVEICAAHEHRWFAMAEAAHRAWQTWFSPEGLGRLVAHSIAEIQTARRLPERLYAYGWPLRTGFLRGRGLLVHGRNLAFDWTSRLRPALSRRQ